MDCWVAGGKDLQLGSLTTEALAQVEQASGVTVCAETAAATTARATARDLNCMVEGEGCVEGSVDDSICGRVKNRPTVARILYKWRESCALRLLNR